MDDYTQAICGDESLILMDGKPLSIDEVLQLLNINEQLLADKQRVLDAIPECPVHGANCIPHALEWIKKQKCK